MGTLVTRIGATGALATVLAGGLVSTSAAITPPVVPAQRIAGPALTEQVRWYGYGYGWRGYNDGGAIAAGAILGGLLGLAAAAPFYGYGYPGYWGSPAFYPYPAYYGGYDPAFYPWPYYGYRRAFWRPYGWGYRRVIYARPYGWRYGPAFRGPYYGFRRAYW